jgi:hypothetical protein
VMKIVINIEMTVFYSSGDWKLDGLGRVASGGGADLMLQF